MNNIDELGLGAFRPELSPNGKHNHARLMMSPTSDADSLFSKRMGMIKNVEEDEEEESDKELIDEGIFSVRVKVGRKFCLLETLNNLKEYKDYGSREEINSINEEEDSLDEITGASAAAGPAVPMGYTSKGKPETSRQRKKRQKFNREKSYPYK